tara:strand:+ start:3146 stop:3685 length:540 start_codon:yes stop_codon:yes gene_type:complete
MKTLRELLTEAKKTYQFKIGVAGDLPEKFNERLRAALEKFEVVSLSAGKKTPIQQTPTDFPQLTNMEVTYWDAELSYPTIEPVLREYLGQFCSIPESRIVVRNPGASIVDKEETGEYEVLLTKEDMGDNKDAQTTVGTARVMDLLKELETARKDRGDTNGFKMETPKKEPINQKSTLGS